MGRVTGAEGTFLHRYDYAGRSEGARHMSFHRLPVFWAYDDHHLRGSRVQRRAHGVVHEGPAGHRM
jgi:hypothetical protein